MTDLHNQTTASFPETAALARVILNALAEKEASIGYGLLGCALTMCRLQNPGVHLSDEDEITFIQSLMDWCSAYFAAGKAN